MIPVLWLYHQCIVNTWIYRPMFFRILSLSMRQYEWNYEFRIQRVKTNKKLPFWRSPFNQQPHFKLIDYQIIFHIYGLCDLFHHLLGTKVTLIWFRFLFITDHSWTLQPLTCWFLFVFFLTHWGRDKMAAVSQTTLSNAFSWMKMLECRLRFHWSLFLRVQLTIIQHWFR